ncbi:PepSY domain-containing protein [Methylococcus sp. EFPC2]|uniref:PepSY-associated TM helix domain-containing protein n=1 Tax=Methylococcus sp. EFPC2 TaxID=2812648 RepID=UPI001967C381|nr:PepSY-associated TM helix domain-containing protein [Methylococcus sp. EFPC2]QSA96003.1 PepSY domain-containing protein [Methylococcus sp. EFPC2]
MPTAKSQRLVRLKSRRKLWLDVHLWLGLIAGVPLLIFGITGSILVFQQEIDEWLNPHLLTVEARPEGYRPLDELIDAGIAALPGASLTFAAYPRNETAALRLRFNRKIPDAPATENREVAVDPYTARVIGQRLMGRSDSPFPKTFIGFIFELHYAFFLGETVGYACTGILGASLIISVLSGLIVWWPLTGKWRQALTLKRRASAERLNFDLHKTSGFYTTLVMLPVLFSGIYMNLPQYVVPVIELFSPVTYRYWFQSTPLPNAEPITLGQAVNIADQRYPSGRPDWIYGAPEATRTYTVCKHDVNEPGSLLHRRCVVMDRYSGKILDIDDPSLGTAGEVFTHWQWPLHSGQAFGMSGRILVFVTGLACPLLFVTGLIRWLQKRRARALRPRAAARA